MVNESLVLEPLKFYCIIYIMYVTVVANIYQQRYMFGIKKRHVEKGKSQPVITCIKNVMWFMYVFPLQSNVT